jgi:hypothetical protein
MKPRMRIILGILSFVTLSPMSNAQAVFTTSISGNSAVVLPTPSKSLPAPTRNLISGFPNGSNPSGAAVFNVNGALIADAGNSRLFAVALSSHTVTATLPMSPWDTSGAIAVSKNGQYAVGCGNSSTLAIVAAPFSATSPVHHVSLPGSCSGSETHNIAFDFKGTAFVQTGAGISVLNSPYTAIAFTFPGATVFGGGALAINADGNTLLATGNVNAINIYSAPFSASSTGHTLTVSGARALDGIALTPDGKTALVSDLGDGTADGTGGVFSIAAPFNTSSIVQRIPLPSSVFTKSTNNGFAEIDISSDGQLAIATGGNGLGAETTSALFIASPFTSSGAVTYAVVVDNNSNGRGQGVARFYSDRIFADGFE